MIPPIWVLAQLFISLYKIFPVNVSPDVTCFPLLVSLQGFCWCCIFLPYALKALKIGFMYSIEDNEKVPNKEQYITSSIRSLSIDHSL